ncbi:uncharacterized protein BKCO1_960007 [Diplodia corticola]|uniref:Uncharacterized protein n=1 Tax=Diplodia corticola TaxID=236234 RepID=A0A1J9QLV0_9PEZI|nr:uncharacterized protein BKCO1_960007 [Diplodia corticola]OJD29042.1 hypothetical protein BKCO1_960007 [Diplodia corticola]
MSHLPYSRIALRDMENPTEAEPVQEVKYTPSSSSTGANVDFEKPQNARKSRRWDVAYSSNEGLMQGTKNMRRATIDAASTLRSDEGWRKPMRHTFAFLTFFIFGLLPLIVYFTILDQPFKAKPVTCGDAAQVREDTPGIEGLFTIDRTAGSFPFWLAKLLDTIWDLVVARGMQLLAGCISYSVFCKAMLHALEASPIPFRTFTGLAMNGASLWTVGCIIRDLGRHSRKRTVLLFIYAAVALVYVLAIPTLFSTMTGYISVSSAFTKVPGTSQFVPTDDFVPGYTFVGLEGVPDNTCISQEIIAPISYKFNAREYTCNSTCLTNFPNGTHKDLATGALLYPIDEYALRPLLENKTCTYFPNETYTGQQLFASSAVVNPAAAAAAMQNLYNPTHTPYNCTGPLTLTIANKTSIPFATALAHTAPSLGYCYNDHGFDSALVAASGRCLPDTSSSSSASYQWGFSAMLASAVLVVHAAWAAGLYAVWVEAECRGEEAWKGRRLGQLGAAWFAVRVAEGEGREGPEGVEAVAEAKGGGGGGGAVGGGGLGGGAWGGGGRGEGEGEGGKG